MGEQFGHMEAAISTGAPKSTRKIIYRHNNARRHSVNMKLAIQLDRRWKIFSNLVCAPEFVLSVNKNFLEE